MSPYSKPIRRIIAPVGLLGASLGMLAGYLEAACLRSGDVSLALQKPHVPLSFWFFSPLLGSLVFGLLGLLVGCLAAIPKSRFLGMLMIAGLAGLMAEYCCLVLQHFPSAQVWFVFLREMLTPNLAFALVSAGLLAVLWATRMPASPLGGLANIPMRPWALVVLGLMAGMALRLAIGSVPFRWDGFSRPRQCRDASAQRRPDRMGHDARRPPFSLRILSPYDAEFRPACQARRSFRECHRSLVVDAARHGLDPDQSLAPPARSQR